ncbi:MAG: hypothetical protein LC620_02510, partial [Halobacteriales archaeon]|nr:hypothetical protein [Halobacteriales archaeon]
MVASRSDLAGHEALEAVRIPDGLLQVRSSAAGAKLLVDRAAVFALCEDLRLMACREDGVLG